MSSQTNGILWLIALLFLCWTILAVSFTHAQDEPCFGWTGIDMTEAINYAISLPEDKTPHEELYSETVFEFLNETVGTISSETVSITFDDYEALIALGDNMAYIMVAEDYGTPDVQVVCHLLTRDFPSDLMDNEFSESA